MSQITVQGIFIKHTETQQQDGKPYTAYRIDIQAPVRQYHLWKRYSDFTRLHAQLEQAFPKLPVSLPTKRIFPPTFNAPESIERRRHGLEHYLRTIQSCRDDRWRKTDIWSTFLSLAPIGNDDEKGMSASAWLDEYEEVCASARRIRSLLNSRASHLTQHAISDAMQCEVQAKRELVALGVRLERLEVSDVSEGEKRRRKDKLDALREDRRVLAQLVAHTPPRRQQQELVEKKPVAVGDIGFQKQQTSPQHKPSIGKGRALGSIAQKLQLLEETEATRGLDNSQLVDYQRQVMQEQDMHLAQFSQLLARQKEIGYAISDELDAQVEVLNELDGQVERTATKLQCASKRLAKIH
ncbi:Phox-like protein [Backusella circina FSU 941]|nr:Phox-like protein [Backusella circina FSU 941]